MHTEEEIIHVIGGELSRETPPSQTYYLTTPIYYINDKPHIGHAYTTILGDVLARYYRLIGYDVAYATGTDENSQKNVSAAIAAGREYDVALYLDEMSDLWKQTWKEMNITNTDFIRTTEERHLVAVLKFWTAVEKTGDIYKGTYSGWYCGGCEAFILESELENGENCAIHKKRVEKIEEENYFFRLTKYRTALLEYITLHPEFIEPDSRKHEIINYIKDHMVDMSISRQSATAGIPVPTDPKHRIYVWFDALINYLSVIGYGTDEKKFAHYWPVNMHLVGKDIIKFHCGLWPAMLMSAGLQLPKKVFAHGFFTIEGIKMSKSLGNAIDPLEVGKRFGNDVLRYFLLREITCGDDGDFSMKRLADRYQTDLGNELGNLVQRVMGMAEKYCGGRVPVIPLEQTQVRWKEYHEAIQALRFSSALDCVWEVVRNANKFIDAQKPWAIYNENPSAVILMMGHLLELLRQIAWLLVPIMPQSADKIFDQLGLTVSEELQRPYYEAIVWGGLKEGTHLKKGESMFPRLS